MNSVVDRDALLYDMTPSNTGETRKHHALCGDDFPSTNDPVLSEHAYCMVVLNAQI